MVCTEIAGRRYLQFAQLRTSPGLVHAYSTRPANLAPRVDRGAAERAVQRAAMAGDWGFAPEELRFCLQVHDTRVALVEESTPQGALEGCDGAITACPGVPLMSFSADCPLILLFDPARQVVATVHASWRCTVAGIVRQVVARLAEVFGSRPADLRAGVGPGAGPCCYEVQQDVYAAAAALAARDRAFAERQGRLYFDLWTANEGELRATGIPAERIERADLCTLCNPSLFYSFRREGAGCGHFGLLAGLTAR